MRFRTTLDQWATLREIEKAGSIQAAAISLNKSHTTVIYGVRKLEQQLGVELLEVKGRKTALTTEGKELLRRANLMLEQAKELELLSDQVAAGMEKELIIAMDHLCDPALLYEAMEAFLSKNCSTSIQVIETSLSKTTSVVTQGLADIAIITVPVTNYPAESFSVTSMVPVVSVNHPLVQLEKVTPADLANTVQIVIRDLGDDIDGKAKRDAGWVKGLQRITVDNFDHAFRAVEKGVGFCRLPNHVIKQRDQGQLSILDVKQADAYHLPLHITLPKGAQTGPAALAMYEQLKRLRVTPHTTNKKGS
ncbi:LysR family transcriptional regulator [Vibrio mediterranei]|nr:LysR family transcriptional regulator [Vibrio mediterranei]